MRKSLKPQRIFSEPVRRHVVQLIEKGKLSVSSARREYGVSETAIYKWLNKYSGYLHSGQTLVIQMDSEASKTQALQQRIKELEAALGRKQLEVDFLNQMLEQGKKELGIDLKKKLLTPPSSGSGPTNRKDTK